MKLVFYDEHKSMPDFSKGEIRCFFCVIGNCVSYDTKTLREDATGAQMNMQADACAHQRAKSRKATLCSVIGV